MLDRLVRIVLVVLNAFLGVSAVYGAVSVVPQLPLDLLTGKPFGDYTIPAPSLGLVGIAAFIAAGLLLVNVPLGALVSVVVGGGIAIFEVVEKLVVGIDVWPHALGLGPAPRPLFAGADSVPAPIGIPIPLWLQPLYFVFGMVVALVALRLYAHTAEVPRKALSRQRAQA